PVPRVQTDPQDSPWTIPPAPRVQNLSAVLFVHIGESRRKALLSRTGSAVRRARRSRLRAELRRRYVGSYLVSGRGRALLFASDCGDRLAYAPRRPRPFLRPSEAGLRALRSHPRHARDHVAALSCYLGLRARVPVASADGLAPRWRDS